MKKILIAIVCFQMCFTVGSCQKPKPLEPIEPKPRPTTYPTNLEVLWEAFWRCSDSTGDYVWDYVVANEQYIVLANTYGSEGRNPRGIGVYILSSFINCVIKQLEFQI